MYEVTPIGDRYHKIWSSELFFNSEKYQSGEWDITQGYFYVKDPLGKYYYNDSIKEYFPISYVLKSVVDGELEFNELKRIVESQIEEGIEIREHNRSSLMARKATPIPPHLYFGIPNNYEDKFINDQSLIEDQNGFYSVDPTFESGMIFQSINKLQYLINDVYPQEDHYIKAKGASYSDFGSTSSTSKYWPQLLNKHTGIYGSFGPRKMAKLVRKTGEFKLLFPGPYSKDRYMSKYAAKKGNAYSQQNHNLTFEQRMRDEMEGHYYTEQPEFPLP